MTILPEQKASLPHFDSFLSKSKIPQGQTDELLTWLSKVNQKKMSIRTTRHRDLRKEALLESSRQAAQNLLQSKQKERMSRWRNMMRVWTPQPEPVEPDNSICDCEACFLCQRHRPQMQGKCYCNVIFSPRPIFMDFHSLDHKSGYDDVEESMEVDKFLSSLSSSDSTDLTKKRKFDEVESEESLVGRKRASA